MANTKDTETSHVVVGDKCHRIGHEHVDATHIARIFGQNVAVCTACATSELAGCIVSVGPAKPR